MEASLKEANFYVLRESECPALLLSVGYLSNLDDLAFITDEEKQALICDKILAMISHLD